MKKADVVRQIQLAILKCKIKLHEATTAEDRELYAGQLSHLRRQLQLVREDKLGVLEQ